MLPALLLMVFALPGPAQYPEEDAWRIARGWYTTYLGRAPGREEAQGWVNALARGEDAKHLLSTFLGTDEYYIRAGSNPEAFIRLLYRDLAGHPPTPAELRAWSFRARREGRDEVAYALLTHYPPGGNDWRRHHERDRDYEYRRPIRREWHR